ncbi:MAG: cytochrome c [Phycisphaerales bacterium]|nr:cytochrome c [Phycisphaerales bacterium]
MPRVIVLTVMVLLLVALVPPVVIARVRSTPSEGRPIHIVQDMDIQPKFKTQVMNPLFADSRAMRPELIGAVARGETYLDPHMNDGVVDGKWATPLPGEIELDMDLLNRGQARFAIYCAPCHGWNGMGQGPVNQRAEALMDNAEGPQDGTIWTQARNLHDPTWSEQPIGQVFNTITNGKNSMAGYAAQVPLHDRWAIAAYVKALQRSQNASMQDVPPDQRSRLSQ